MKFGRLHCQFATLLYVKNVNVTTRLLINIFQYILLNISLHRGDRCPGSYTHLDEYKRQNYACKIEIRLFIENKTKTSHIVTNILNKKH